MTQPPPPEPRPYQRVYADLRARIEHGDLPIGSRLPSQPALAAEYGVALLTVRHAIELLRRGGYLSVEHGRGTFVAKPRAAGTVLVVDDDAYQRALLVELLRHHGFAAREAPDGSSALEAVDEETFTHVFLDFRMPGLGGADVARLIRERDDRAVIVFLSAYPEDVLRMRTGGIDPVAVLSKPIDPADVLAALRLSLAPGELKLAPGDPLEPPDR